MVYKRHTLYLAATSPHGADTMNLLLRHDKGDVDAVSRDGLSALENAFACRNPAAEAALLDAGADPSRWQFYAPSLPEYVETVIEGQLNPRHLQTWYRTYSLIKARHLHAAITDIRDRPMLAQRVSTRSRAKQRRPHSAPACLQQRVRAGGCLPEVELRVLQDEDEKASGGRKRGKPLREGSDDPNGGARGTSALESMVVVYAAAEMSRELFVEMMGWVPITADAETSAGAVSTAEA